MHDLLRARLLRSVEALPEAQLYQALDYVEFLASKYAREQVRAPSAVQKFGEVLEDKLRAQNVAMGAIKGTMGVLSTADRMFSGISEAGRSLMRSVEQGMSSATDAMTGPRTPTDDAAPDRPRLMSGDKDGTPPAGPAPQ
ncbi:MAG TPA: hypothetical protein VFH27_12135 [Longimicrobiaceae bacterium]|nr:hypothetical protein [Longimicrobiaceae bacterium]